METNDVINAMFDYTTGYLIVVTTISKQNRKHHKFRINKKWIKKYGFTYREVQTQDVILDESNHMVYVTKKGYEKLLKICGVNTWIEQKISVYRP